MPGVYVKWKLDPCGALGVKRGGTADPGADTPFGCCEEGFVLLGVAHVLAPPKPSGG